jgi:hypothetical protein
VQANTCGEGSVRQAGREPPGVDERGVGLVPKAADVGRGGDLSADGLAVEELVLVAEALEEMGVLL